MINDPQVVRDELRKKVLQGYNPMWDYESAEDHWVDWLVLSKEEFDSIKQSALEARERTTNTARQ